MKWLFAQHAVGLTRAGSQTADGATETFDRLNFHNLSPCCFTCGKQERVTGLA